MGFSGVSQEAPLDSHYPADRAAPPHAAATAPATAAGPAADATFCDLRIAHSSSAHRVCSCGAPGRRRPSVGDWPWICFTFGWQARRISLPGASTC
ncbi:hypothetical protein SCOCK_10065 [Actinacidiphila cocklensis]|uniref:Uncharacterized protein n=1 Tax=Actinacidiphila cocklensis TaxID=887465 RepID=A0A9W4GNJ0_9ACTN|nr:hypothetical protein SCOCK_10065 [Actinacidiphila cocklensis]